MNSWKEGHKPVVMVYEITKTFPKEETFGLMAQMRRSAVSITSNIAEGFSRRFYKEKIRFYSIAQGSVTELQNQLLIAKDVGFLQEEQFQGVAEQAVTVHKITNGLIRGAKSRNS